MEGQGEMQADQFIVHLSMYNNHSSINYHGNTVWLSPLQGTIGFEQHIDKCLDLSQYLYNKIKNREGYKMVFDGVVSFFLLKNLELNVCFL